MALAPLMLNVFQLTRMIMGILQQNVLVAWCKMQYYAYVHCRARIERRTSNMLIQ